MYSYRAPPGFDIPPRPKRFHAPTLIGPPKEPLVKPPVEPPVFVADADQGSPEDIAFFTELLAASAAPLAEPRVFVETPLVAPTDEYMALREAALAKQNNPYSFEDLFEWESDEQKLRATSGIAALAMRQFSVIDSLLLNVNQIENSLRDTLIEWIIVSRGTAEAAAITDLRIIPTPYDGPLDAMAKRATYDMTVEITWRRVIYRGQTIMSRGKPVNLFALSEKWHEAHDLEPERGHRRMAGNLVDGVDFIYVYDEDPETYRLVTIPIIVGSKWCTADPEDYGREIAKGYSVVMSNGKPTIRMYPWALRRIQDWIVVYRVASSNLLVSRVSYTGPLGFMATSVFESRNISGDTIPRTGKSLSYVMPNEIPDELCFQPQEYRQTKPKAEPTLYPVRYNALVALAYLEAKIAGKHDHPRTSRHPEKYVERAHAGLLAYLESVESKDYRKACAFRLEATLAQALDKITQPLYGCYLASLSESHITKEKDIYSQLVTYLSLPKTYTGEKLGIAIINRMMHAIYQAGTDYTPEDYDSIRHQIYMQVHSLYRIVVANYELEDKESWNRRTIECISMKIVDEIGVKYIQWIREFLRSKPTNMNAKQLSRYTKKAKALATIHLGLDWFSEGLQTEITSGMINGDWADTSKDTGTGTTTSIGAHPLTTARVYEQVQLLHALFDQASKDPETRMQHPKQADVSCLAHAHADQLTVGKLRAASSCTHISLSRKLADVARMILGLLTEYEPLPIDGQNMFRVMVNNSTATRLDAEYRDVVIALLRHEKRTGGLPFDVEISTVYSDVNVQCTSGRAMTPHFVCEPGTTRPSCYATIKEKLGDTREEQGGDSQYQKMYDFDFKKIVRDGHVEWLSINEVMQNPTGTDWSPKDFGCTYVKISPSLDFSMHLNLSSLQEHNEGPRTIYFTTTSSSFLCGRTKLTDAVNSSGAMKKQMRGCNMESSPLKTPGAIAMDVAGLPWMYHVPTALLSMKGDQTEDCLTFSTRSRECGFGCSKKTTQLHAVKEGNVEFQPPYVHHASDDAVVKWREAHPYLHNYGSVIAIKIGTRTTKDMVAVAMFSVSDRSIGTSSLMIPHYLNGIVTGVRIVDGRNGPERVYVTVTTVYQLTDATKLTDLDAQKAEVGRLWPTWEMPHYVNKTGDFVPLMSVAPSASQPSRNTGGRSLRHILVAIAVQIGITPVIDMFMPIRMPNDPEVMKIYDALGWSPTTMYYDHAGQPIGAGGFAMHEFTLSNQHWGNKYQARGMYGDDATRGVDISSGNLNSGRGLGLSRGTFGTQEGPLLFTEHMPELIKAFITKTTANIKEVPVCKPCGLIAYVVAEADGTYKVVCDECGSSIRFTKKFQAIPDAAAGVFIVVSMRQSMMRTMRHLEGFGIRPTIEVSATTASRTMRFEDIPPIM